MKFHKIVCVDHTKLQPWALEELQQYSEEEMLVYKIIPIQKKRFSKE